MDMIADHLKEKLIVVFIGFNPSIRSGQVGHHYANPNNRFWRILHESGLTSRKYTPSEDKDLLNAGYGFTNIVSRPTKAADEITKQEYASGREQLKQKLELYKPKIACYVGKGVYQEFKQKRDIPWGSQSNSVVPGTIDFVAPSSSGLVRMKLGEIVDIYRELTHLIKYIE
jgi:double-stranded uracil-DNA glycosylase